MKFSDFKKNGVMIYNGCHLKLLIDTETKLYFNYFWASYNIGGIFTMEFEEYKMNLLNLVGELYTNAEITIVSRCEANKPRFDIILTGDDTYKLSIDWTREGRYGDDHIEKFALLKNGEKADMNEDIKCNIMDALYKTAIKCLVHSDESEEVKIQ